MVLTCGLLLLDETGHLFLAHATGTSRWDLPKGQAEPGESARDAAVREALEEAGFDARHWGLTDLGEMAYRPGKRMHLFAARIPRQWVDCSACRCTSTFLHKPSGRSLPEVDQYEWVAQDQWAARVAPNLLKVLTSVLPRAQTLPLQA